MSEETTIEAQANEIDRLNQKLQIVQCSLGYLIEKHYPKHEIIINFEDVVKLFSDKLTLLGEQSLMNGKVILKFTLITLKNKSEESKTLN
jgi:hypothetical protein